MNINYVQLLHHMICGGVAAMGFGVLFNMGYRALPWCGIAGAAGLAVRTLGLQLGWSLEAASFVAALVIGTFVQILQTRINVSRNTLDVASCIPMIPGAFAAKAILGLFALTVPVPQRPDETLILSVANGLRVLFTIGAMGTALAIPSLTLNAGKSR